MNHLSRPCVSLYINSHIIIIMNNKCLFSEGAYEQNYIEHNCDDVYSLYEYDKLKTIKQPKVLIWVF